MREINKKEVVLTIPTQNIFNKNFLFQDKNGENVVSGDGVEFYYNSHLPKFGYVENYKTLRIACFDHLFDKWEYYKLV